jgi:hypothetical protein
VLWGHSLAAVPPLVRRTRGFGALRVVSLARKQFQVFNGWQRSLDLSKIIDTPKTILNILIHHLSAKISPKINKHKYIHFYFSIYTFSAASGSASPKKPHKLSSTGSILQWWNGRV